MSDISNKPLDKAAIIRRLSGEGFAFAKRPSVLASDEDIKAWLSQVKEGAITQEQLLSNIKDVAQDDSLNALCYVVNLSECMQVPVPELKRELGLLLLERCAYTALELVNPDMCDLAQVYFREINDQDLWVKAHAKAQEGFPTVFSMAQELRDVDDRLRTWAKARDPEALSIDEKDEFNGLVSEYLKKTIELMDMFSMLDAMYVTRQIDVFFSEHYGEFLDHLNEKVEHALNAFKDHNTDFARLQSAVSDLYD